MKKQLRKQLKKVLSVVLAVTLLVLSASVGFSFSAFAADTIDPTINELVSYAFIDFRDSENVVARDGQGVYITGSPISGTNEAATKYEEYYKTPHPAPALLASLPLPRISRSSRA